MYGIFNFLSNKQKQDIFVTELVSPLSIFRLFGFGDTMKRRFAGLLLPSSGLDSMEQWQCSVLYNLQEIPHSLHAKSIK